MTTTTPGEGRQIWGGLAEPLHPDAAGPSDPRWLDTAYLGFWSEESDTFGVVHLMTSPNGEGRRARCTLSVRGERAELIEDLARDTFTSDSIDFDVFGPGGTVQVDHPSMGIELSCARRFGIVGFDPYSVVAPLPGRDPLVHYEGWCDVDGRVRVGETWHPIIGRAFRDRSWGFRDESAQITEWVALCASFDDCDLCMLKVLWGDEFRTEAYLNDRAGTHRVSDFHVTRDAAGMCKQVRVVVDDGDVRVVRAVRQLGVAPIPLGTDREGPALASFDEYLVLDCDGQRGGGYCEQGVLHRVW